MLLVILGYYNTCKKQYIFQIFAELLKKYFVRKLADSQWDKEDFLA